jgi:hypothetical protein
MITLDDLKTVAAIAGGIIGALGFLYGLIRDRQLREIEKRVKAPHFIFRNLQIDAPCRSTPAGGPSYYSYRKQACSLADRLFDMGSDEVRVPEDYPDGRVVGIVLANRGATIRFFTAKCEEEHLFQVSEMDGNWYEFRYRFNKTEFDKRLKFVIKFETDAGYRGKQIWQVEKGTAYLARVKPKAL